MSITLNPVLISNLNELKKLPIPVAKLIVDQIMVSVISSSDGINFNMLERIVKVEMKGSCDWKSGIRSLHFFFKYAIKNQYPVKAIGVFLTEKTLLGDLADYACLKYEQTMTKTVSAPRQAKLQQASWATCNLRQNRNHQTLNKMYVKLYLRTLDNGHEQEKAINCQLPELKLLLSEINQLNANMK